MKTSATSSITITSSNLSPRMLAQFGGSRCTGSSDRSHHRHIKSTRLPVLAHHMSGNPTNQELGIPPPLPIKGLVAYEVQITTCLAVRTMAGGHSCQLCSGYRLPYSIRSLE